MTCENQERAHRMAMVQQVVRSQGAPLDPAVRALMEARFGRNFGQVRLHTDELAAASACALSAQAYAVGSHIVFRAGRYRPGTHEGLWLLAHELAHVIQQRGKCSTRPLGVGDATDPLEREADRVADLIEAGCSLPPDFTFGSALTSVIQRHNPPAPGSEPCGGWVHDPDPDTIRQAHRLIEQAYVPTIPGGTRSNAVFYGSNWANDLQVPPGARNLALATELLNRMLQLPVENRPNIIDLWNLSAYFFRWRQYNARDVSAITAFHNIVEHIDRRYGGNWQWYSDLATWFPNHVLKFPGDPLKRFVCTQATTHVPRGRGMILFDVRAPQRQRRRVSGFDVWDQDLVFSRFFQTFEAEVPNKIQLYDPENSNFVIIAPKDFYQQMHQEDHNNRQNRLRQNLVIQPSYNFPGGQWIKDLKGYLRGAVVLTGAVAFTVLIVGTIAIIVLVPPAGVAAGAAVTTGVAPGVTVPTAVVVEQIIVPAGMAAKLVASGAITGGAVAAVGTFEATMTAMAAAPAAKLIAGSAGVLMVFFNSKSARAATGNSATGNSADARFSAIRAVAVADFQSIGGVQSASSFGPPMNFQSTETAKGKFGLHTQVFFNNEPHIIIGQFSAK